MKIDAHTHIFPPDVVASRERLFSRDPFFKELYENPRARMASAEQLVAELDAAGFDLAVACGWGWTDHALCVEQNDYLIDAVRRFPRRIVGFAAVQPAAGERAVQEAERALKGGLGGIGELMPHGQGYQLDQSGQPDGAPLLAPLAALAVERGVPILTHTSEPVGHLYPGKGNVTVQTVVNLASAFPDLKLICGHWGGGLPFYELMKEVAASLANVYYDTAASPYLYDPRVYRAATVLAGPEKILFGSDYPLLKIARCARQVVDAALPEEDTARILGLNAARLLGLG